MAVMMASKHKRFDTKTLNEIAGRATESVRHMSVERGSTMPVLKDGRVVEIDPETGDIAIDASAEDLNFLNQLKLPNV